ncbi:MAG: NifB/NifX family molybdenum-iron cluster-binding protein [Anaeroplasma sp.]
MKIAVTYKDGKIFQHFGHTEYFKVYEIENDRIIASKILSSNGTGHGALAGFLKENGINILICGGIGTGAQNALINVGINFYGGVSGDADEAVLAFTKGTLIYNPNVKCNHHGNKHSCGDEGCH